MSCLQSAFCTDRFMQNRLKFETGRLHFRRHIAGMVLLSPYFKSWIYTLLSWGTFVDFVATALRTRPISKKRTAFNRERTAKERVHRELSNGNCWKNVTSILTTEDSSEIHLEKVCYSFPVNDFFTVSMNREINVAPVSVSRTIEKWNKPLM